MSALLGHVKRDDAGQGTLSHAITRFGVKIRPADARCIDEGAVGQQRRLEFAHVPQDRLRVVNLDWDQPGDALQLLVSFATFRTHHVARNVKPDIARCFGERQ